MNPTAQNLSDIMEFDHVIRVDEDGNVTEPRDAYAPDRTRTAATTSVVALDTPPVGV